MPAGWLDGGGGGGWHALTSVLMRRDEELPRDTHPQHSRSSSSAASSPLSPSPLATQPPLMLLHCTASSSTFEAHPHPPQCLPNLNLMVRTPPRNCCLVPFCEGPNGR